MTSLWQATAPHGPDCAPLDGDRQADLVILGGGFTGCSAALHAAQAGLRVCLLEAQTIGFGGSGRNVGLVNAGLWLPPEVIETQMGIEAGKRLNAVLGEAPDLVFSLIEAEGISCEAVRNGTLHCAHSAGGLTDLRNRHRQLADRGAPVSILSAQDTAARTGAQGFHGALHDARAGTIQPLAYVRGLAAAAIRHGAELFEQTPADHVLHDGHTWVVETPAGRVTAPNLLVATNAYHGGALGLDPPQSVPVHYFQIATAPLGDNLRGVVLPGAEGCWDTATVMSSFRVDQAGRVILGGIGALQGAGKSQHPAWARRKLAALYPALADQPIEHCWHGRISMTSDHVPKIQRLGPGGYAIFGYSGRGIGPGTVFGKAAAEAVAGAGDAAFPVDPVDMHRERFVGLRERFYQLGATLTHMAFRG